MHDENLPRTSRRVYAKDLNDITARIVRAMLIENDINALRDTGSGTPDEAALMLRCYELATLPYWDKQALIDAATVAGDDHLFTLAGGGRKRIERCIDSAFNAGAVPATLNPAEGVALIFQLRLSVWDELEEAVSQFKSRGWYEGAEAEGANVAPSVHSIERKETPEARRTRLRERANELKMAGVKAWLKQLATEEGISIPRIKQLLADDAPSVSPTSIAGQFAAMRKR